MSKKSLIIGFGNRAKEVVMPALVLLGHEISIYSRDVNKLKNYKNYFNFKIIKELNKKNLHQIDQIFICTKNHIYQSIIQKILKTGLNKNITLFVDTPLLYHFFEIKKFRNNFKNLIISEDEAFNPINVVIKELIKKNPSHELFQINLNFYGLIAHSISQIISILNLNNNIEQKIKYGIYLNLKKIKYLLKISEIKIFFNNGRDWLSDKSNIEICLKKKNENKIIKKYKVEYIFKKNIFYGFKVNNVKYENKFVEGIKNKINFYSINSKYQSSQVSQIKILSFSSMINFYENNHESNIINYIKCEYFGSLTKSMRLFINFKFDLIKLRKLLYKLKRRI